MSRRNFPISMAQKKRVLVVDDDIEVPRLIRLMLKREKLEVIEALCAEEALDILENESVSLVISDLKMPGMSGVNFLAELREWDAAIPVIFVTGYGKEKDWDRVFRYNASAIIEKPFRRETILKAVRKALEPKPDGKASPSAFSKASSDAYWD